MQLDKLRIYYNAVLGAFGGLAGWALITLVLRFQTETTLLLLMKDALLGAVVGACIGFALGCAEDLGGRLAWPKPGPSFASAAIGLVAGLVGLVAGEAIFLLAGGGVWPRALGWALFGLMLGLGQWAVTGMPSKGFYGALGGLIGGLIGGATYERLALVLRGVGMERELALTAGGAVGLLILGACIAAFIGLVEDILRNAWLRFTHGPLEGQTRSLDARRPVITLGRADRSDIYLHGDPDIARIHAEIRNSPAGFTISGREGTVLLRNAGALIPVQSHHLRDGDMLQIGRTRFVFRSAEGERK
jgi:hypothetical protein